MFCRFREEIMTERLLPKEQIFQNWGVHETSRIVGTAGRKEVEEALLNVKKWIAQHHISVAQPYFYSAKKVDVLATPLAKKGQIERIARETQGVFFYLFVTCIGVAVIVYWKTAPFFKKKWAECKAFAEEKKMGVDHQSGQGFIRCAAPQDIWGYHEKFTTARKWYHFRNAFCITSPIWGFFFSSEVYKLHLKRMINERVLFPYDIVVERLRDERICPSNFDIDRDVALLTNEKISIEQLRSPQMIYLPNYVTGVQGFMSAILRAGKKEFVDPCYRHGFTTEERQAIILQILAIFQITEEELNLCFERGGNPDNVRYSLEKHPKALDERGQFTEEAKERLQESFGDLADPALPKIDDFVDREIEGRVREHCTRDSSDTLGLLRNDSVWNASLTVQVGSLPVLVTVNLVPVLAFNVFKERGLFETAQLEQKVNDKIKEELRRSIRSQILGTTGFYEELKKDDLAESRIDYFEKKREISLTPPID